MTLLTNQSYKMMLLASVVEKYLKDFEQVKAFTSQRKQVEMMKAFVGTQHQI